MKRDAFGKPQPANADEVAAALEEAGVEAADCQATIENFPDEKPPFKGWAGTIHTPDGDQFELLGLPSAEAWRKELRDAGITEIDVMR